MSHADSALSFLERRANRAEQKQKTLAVYTIRYANHPYATREGITTLDARSSVGFPFAIPSPNLKRAMLDSPDGSKDEFWFLDMYREQLEQTYAKHKHVWLGLMAGKKIAIGCEHKHDDILAHRMILRAFLCDKAIENGYTIFHGGEIHVNPRTQGILYRRD